MTVRELILDLLNRDLDAPVEIKHPSGAAESIENIQYNTTTEAVTIYTT